MTSYSDLRGQADREWQAFIAPRRPHIAVTVSTDSHAVQGAATLREFERLIAERGIAADIGITGSIGLSYQQPTVLVTRPDGSRVLYGSVTPERVGDFLD